MIDRPLQRARRGADGIMRRTTKDRVRTPTRRTRNTALVLALVAVAGGVTAAALALRPGDEAASPRDALEAETLAELQVFANWLSRHDVRGYIGEVGWPDDARGEAEDWNRLAEAWYDRAEGAALWVTAWAVSGWFAADYPLAVYDAGPAGLAPSSQAEVVERRPPHRLLTGVSVAGGEFGTESASFSNAAPGIYGQAYRYEPAETFEYLAERGLALVRLPFRWERVQPRLGDALDSAEVSRIATTVARAHAAGLEVVLDLHNYGEYRTADGPLRLGGEISDAQFADTWRRLAVAFGDVPGIAGYGLMNEPAQVQSREQRAERSWESASQAAVSAIRATGDRRTVFVSGYPWGSVHDWPSHHPRPWIIDPADDVRYEAHHYWDGDRSGTYTATYAEELAAARRR